MSKFLANQCNVSEMVYPDFCMEWINIRKHFVNFYDMSRKVNLAAMVEALGLEFMGKAHSGIADSRNIARIAIRMMQVCLIC